MPEKFEINVKTKLERLIEFAILFLTITSLVYGIINSSIKRGTDKDSVIKNALDYCRHNYYALDMKEEPQQAKAESMTCSEVQEKTIMNECDDRTPDSKMWFISTDGLWLLYGPASIDGSYTGPIQIDACYVLIDGKTGERLEVRYSE